jgi:hypothetical protein
MPTYIKGKIYKLDLRDMRRGMGTLFEAMGLSLAQ